MSTEAHFFAKISTSALLLSGFLALQNCAEPTSSDWNPNAGLVKQNAPYGEMPPARPSQVTVRQLLGINTIWGWGHPKYSDSLSQNEGPALFTQVASHARNYHNLEWDILDPDMPPEFEKMAAGFGTPAEGWLNWDREYTAWKKAGLQIQVALMFDHFKPEQWNSPYQSAYGYGQAFAKHFGKKSGNGLVAAVEIGNEPWTYPAAVYKQILLGMARGIKETDSTMLVFPCALQATDPTTEQTQVFKNYMGTRLMPEIVPYLDGINAHCYSHLPGKFFERKAAHPEHPQSFFREILNAIRFRDANLPGKKLILSEWGWDTDGGGEYCRHPQCVSENAAAIYAVRGALMAMRLGVESACWYFYANTVSDPPLFTRSGLVSSYKTGFQKKAPFFSLKKLVEHLGNQRFIGVLSENENGWIYLFGDVNLQPTHVVAWLPVAGESSKKRTVKITLPADPVAAYYLNGNEILEAAELPVKNNDGLFGLPLSATPLLLKLK